MWKISRPTARSARAFLPRRVVFSIRWERPSPGFSRISGRKFMKVSLNLATLSTARERYALAWAIPLALLGLTGLVALTYSAIFNYQEYRRNEITLNGYLRQEDVQKSAEAALRKDLDQPQQ